MTPLNYLACDKDGSYWLHSYKPGLGSELAAIIGPFDSTFIVRSVASLIRNDLDEYDKRSNVPPLLFNDIKERLYPGMSMVRVIRRDGVYELCPAVTRSNGRVDCSRDMTKSINDADFDDNAIIAILRMYNFL